MTTFTLAAVGDIMLGDHPVCFGHGVRSAIRSRGLLQLLKEVHPLIQEHNGFLGNLECVLSELGHDPSSLSSSELRGDPKSAPSLNFCKYNMLSMANNHMLQHSPQAFQETTNLLLNNNILPMGLYDRDLSNVARIQHGDVRLAFVAYSFRPEHFCANNHYYAQSSEQQIIDQVISLKRQSPEELIIVSLHWGEEYLHTPSSTQIDFAHRLIDGGAALIVGHHPHVLQGVEIYKGGLIAYSLGNFVFDSWQLPTRESAILSCTFEKNGLVSHKLIPVLINTDLSLSIDSTNQILEKIQNFTQHIIEGSDLASLDPIAYADVAKKAYLKYRLQCYWYFVTHILKYEPKIIATSLFRAILRRFSLA